MAVIIIIIHLIVKQPIFKRIYCNLNIFRKL